MLWQFWALLINQNWIKDLERTMMVAERLMDDFLARKYIPIFPIGTKSHEKPQSVNHDTVY